MNKKSKKKMIDSVDAESPQVFAVEMEAGKAKFTRRDFLKAAGVATTAAALAGCAPAPTPEPTSTAAPTPVPTATNTPTPIPTLQPWNCASGRAHTDSVSQISLSSQGDVFASRGRGENTVKLWSLANGGLYRVLTGHEGEVTSMVITLKGDLLATGDADGMIKLWSLPDGIEQTSFTAESDVLLRVNRDGSLLASRSADGNIIRFWSLPEGNQLTTIQDDTVDRLLYSISPNGRFVITTGSDQNTTKLWSLPDGTLLKSIENTNASGFFTSDSSMLILGGSDGRIRMWSLPDVINQKTLNGLGSIVDTISPDGRYFVSVGGDKESQILIWSLPDGELLHTLTHTEITGLWTTISPDSQLLVSYGDGPTIKLWSLPEGNLLSTLEPSEDKTVWIDITPDSQYLISSPGDTSLEIWSLIDGSQVNMILHEAWITDFKCNNDSNLLIVGGENGSIRLWSLPEGNDKSCLVDLDASPPLVQGVKYSVESNGQIVEYTLPCGAAIPAGAVCTCNCVGGSSCSCEGYSSCACVGYAAPCSCNNFSGGSHYWHPN